MALPEECCFGIQDFLDILALAELLATAPHAAAPPSLQQSHYSSHNWAPFPSDFPEKEEEDSATENAEARRASVVGHYVMYN